MKKRTMNKAGEKLSMPKWSDKANRHRGKNKLCEIAGCNREFFGLSVQKYCDLHRDPKSDARKAKRMEERIAQKEKIKAQDVNAYNKNHYTETVNAVFVCALPGCITEFSQTIYPKQEVYAKFCPDHRSEHRRNLFIKNHEMKNKKG